MTRSTLRVDHHRALAERDRGDRGGGIGADAGQLAQPRLAVGKARRAGDLAGAGDQVAGARIIAEPRPGGQDFGVLGGGQRLDRRPARDEALEIAASRSATVVC